MVSDLDDDAASSGKTARLRQHVEELAGTIGERNVFRPEALRAAADSISSIWRAQGHRVEIHRYATHGVDCANLEESRPSVSRPADILLLGAHYDSVRGSPGANDNASGVAALLEIARAFGAFEPTITVRFVAFVNEEPPFFMTRHQGSAVHTRAARAGAIGSG